MEEHTEIVEKRFTYLSLLPIFVRVQQQLYELNVLFNIIIPTSFFNVN